MFPWRKITSALGCVGCKGTLWAMTVGIVASRKTALVIFIGLWFIELSGSSGSAGQAEQSQQNALESKLTPTAIKPFLQGVGSAAGATAADGDGLESQRKWDVGVGGSALYLGCVSQLCVHRADHLHNVGIGMEFAGGAIADGHQLATESEGPAVRRDTYFGGLRFLLYRLIQGMAQGALQALHLRHRSGADIHPHAG